MSEMSQEQVLDRIAPPESVEPKQKINLEWTDADQAWYQAKQGNAVVVNERNQRLYLSANSSLPATDPHNNPPPNSNTHVFFYERDFYPFSSFSSFKVWWGGIQFDTAEQCYHWNKFVGRPDLQIKIMHASSAHEAFEIAQQHRAFYRKDWEQGDPDDPMRQGEITKVAVMRSIIEAKLDQHPYVQQKLIATGNRIMVEDSWRDDYWGWGPNRDGKNMLGKLWMDLRSRRYPHLSSAAA